MLCRGRRMLPMLRVPNVRLHTSQSLQLQTLISLALRYSTRATERGNVPVDFRLAMCLPSTNDSFDRQATHEQSNDHMVSPKSYESNFSSRSPRFPVSAREHSAHIHKLDDPSYVYYASIYSIMDDEEHEDVSNSKTEATYKEQQKQTLSFIKHGLDLMQKSCPAFVHTSSCIYKMM